MNDPKGIILVFIILAAVMFITSWQNKTGKKISDIKGYNVIKWAVLGVLGLGVVSILILSMYGASQL